MNKYGHCKICNRKTKLTFEHIPAKSAYNNEPLKLIKPDEYIRHITDPTRKIWDYSNLQYTQMQKGMGYYSLCEHCNNFTGSKYNPEYIKFVKIAIENLNKNNYTPNKFIELDVSNINLSRLIKQIITMFCSVSPNLTIKYPIIKKIILNEKYVIENLDNLGFRIGIYLLSNQIIGINGYFAYYQNNEIRSMSTIDFYPIGLVFEYSPKIEFEIPDITYFLQNKNVCNKTIKLPVYERNTLYPMDFRLKRDFDNYD